MDFKELLVGREVPLAWRDVERIPGLRDEKSKWRDPGARGQRYLEDQMEG
jgi:hypothetical protein